MKDESSTNESSSRQGGPARGRPLNQSGNPRTERPQTIGGGHISREEERAGRVGGEGHTTPQSGENTDGGEPSRQTSTAKDMSGQV